MRNAFNTCIVLFFAAFLIFSQSALVFADQNEVKHENVTGTDKVMITAQLEKNENAEEEAGGMAGMDEAVNEKYAEDAGMAPIDPYINLEALGDAWNAVMMLAGGICGFIIGRWWHVLFGEKKKWADT